MTEQGWGAGHEACLLMIAAQAHFVGAKVHRTLEPFDGDKPQ